jgi:hypothetical protein
VAQARHPGARARFVALLTEGRLAACQMTALEYFNNAPDPRAYEVLWAALHAQRYDRIAALTGQPVEWVAPRGSL